MLVGPVSDLYGASTASVVHCHVQLHMYVLAAAGGQHGPLGEQPAAADKMRHATVSHAGALVTGHDVNVQTFTGSVQTSSWLEFLSGRSESEPH